MSKEPIKIDVLVEDPNMGEEGTQFHKRYSITAEKFDASPMDDRDQLEMAMQQIAQAISNRWESERSDESL